MIQLGQMLHHPGNCLNAKKPFARACTICLEACPHQAISNNHRINASSCTECGVCMAACPSDGFVDRSLDDLHAYLTQPGEDKIILNCPQAVPSGWEIPCLGIIDKDLWLILLLSAQLKSVALLTGDCTQCPDKEACAFSVRIFSGIHKVWPDHPQLQIIVKRDSGELNLTPKFEIKKPKELNLRNLRELSRKKVEGWLPGLVAEETYNIPKTRQWLEESLKTQEKLSIPFQALVAEDSCTSCGVCAAICPQGALSKRQNGEILQLIYEPFKCVHCQRCVEICQPKALHFEEKSFNHRLLTGKILLSEGTPRYCSICGKQIFDHSEPLLCLACRTRNVDRREQFL